MRLGRTFAALVLLLLAAGTGACSRCDDDPRKVPPTVDGPDEAWLEGRLPPEVLEGAPVPGGTLTVRLASEPPMLNRLHDAGQDGWALRIVFGHVVETLCTYDHSGTPPYALLPLLSTTCETSADGLTSTYRLREGVTFHDGSAFTSSDVKAVFDAIVDPRNEGATARVRSYLEDVAGWEAPDPHTFIVRWKRPSPLGVRNVSTLIPMFPEASLEGDFDALAINRAPVGTGPFRFEGWETGRAITLARYDGYWGRRAWLDRVVFRIVKDQTVATQLWERGEFDLMTAIPPNVWRALERPAPQNAWAWRGYHRIRFIENAYNSIAWNQARPFFADVRVRRALAHLLPAGQIERDLLLGLEPFTTCPFYSKSDYCDPALEARDSPRRIRFDPDRARALLDEAGWKDTDGDGVRDKDGVPLRFTFLIYAHSQLITRLAPVFQESLRRAGVEMDIERVDWAVYVDRMRAHDFDVVALGWSSVDAEDDLFHNFHSSQARGGTNYVGYIDEEMDRLLERSRRELDRDARIALNREIHRRVYEAQIYTFLGVRSSLDAVKTHVRGIRPALDWYHLADVWLAR